MLKEQLEKVNRLAAENELPDVTLTAGMKFKIPQPSNSVPKEAQPFADSVYSLLPRIKITDPDLSDLVRSTYFGDYFLQVSWYG